LPKTGGAMSGAITTNSTFDGRDVATDGSKLDGIEASATADQTAAQIKTHLENGIDSVHYVDGSIDRVHLAADIIDGTKIANDVINSEHYVAGSIDLEHMAANSVDSNQYVDRSIDAVHIATGAITANELAANSVDSSELVSGSIDTTHIANDAVTTDKLANSINTSIAAALLKTGGTMSGTLTLSGGYTAGYLIVPQNSKSAAYTLVSADAGKHILHPAADTTARTFTLPSNSSVAYTIGTTITFVNENSAGVMTIGINSDTMRLAGDGTTGNRTLAANGVATAVKVSSTSWIISGGASLT